MDRILYSPKEGTTGFWGLRLVPEKPNVTLTCNENCEGECGDICPVISSSRWQLEQYELGIESCKEKKLEIVNPEECFTYGPYAINGSNEVIKFKEGEIFDLPIGYEFKEETILSGGWVPTYNNPDNNGLEESAEPMQVLRLVNTETKGVTIENVGENGIIIEGNNRINILAPGGKCVLQRPEPEESQESMINEIINLWRLGGNPEGIKSIFTIQRKKQ